MADIDEDELLADLGFEVAPLKAASHTPKEERIIAGFEDILRFHQTHGRAPQHGEGNDIFERLYAVRLDQLRKLPEAKNLLAHLDTVGLLSSAFLEDTQAQSTDEDDLLAELGVNADGAAGNDMTVLRHVRSYAAIKAAEEIASRKRCTDFEKFKPLFDEAINGLKAGHWIEKPYMKNAGIDVGDLFIVGGQVAYVAQALEDGKTNDGRPNPRLRIIFDNGTEGDLLLRSLARSLYPDGDAPMGRRLIKLDDGPLFGDSAEPEDVATGTIYVLRSKSTQPYIAQHRELIHKIGVTGGKVETRIDGAEKEATYLLAEVEIVATFKLHNINCIKLENLFHRLFSATRLDLTIQDRFGNPVRPQEWFLVPLHVINEAVERVKDGSIADMRYDPKTASLLKS